MGDQPKTPRSRAMGVPLYPVPGGCRSGLAGEFGIRQRASRQCGVTEPSRAGRSPSMLAAALGAHGPGVHLGELSAPKE